MDKHVESSYGNDHNGRYLPLLNLNSSQSVSLVAMVTLPPENPDKNQKEDLWRMAAQGNSVAFKKLYKTITAQDPNEYFEGITLLHAVTDGVRYICETDFDPDYEAIANFLLAKGANPELPAKNDPKLNSNIKKGATALELAKFPISNGFGHDDTENELLPVFNKHLENKKLAVKQKSRCPFSCVIL